MQALERLYGHQLGLRGGFQGLGPSQPTPPFRPPNQEPAAVPPRMYVDQIENGRANLIDPSGHAQVVPADAQWREGHMTDGSASPPTHQLHYLPWPDDGVIRLGEELPKVPLAPGSPGPAVSPGVNHFVDQPPKKKRRPTP